MTARRTTLRRAPRGLTLVELLVVLFLLALLATLAVQSTEGFVQQGRFDATRKTLEQVERSVLGPVATEYGSNEPIVSFVADMGRLPIAAGLDPETQLAELWLPPSDSAQLYTIRQSTSGTDADSDVRLGGGWRGPYLRLAAGETRLLDGWGKAFAIFQTDGVTIATSGDTVGLIASLGSDNAVGGPVGDAYSTDLPLTRPFTSAAVTTQIVGSVEDANMTSGASAAAKVILFEPVEISTTHPDGIRERVENLEWDSMAMTFDANFTFSGLTIGPKAIRVVQGTKKSSVIYLQVPPGGMTLNVKFDLQ